MLEIKFLSIWTDLSILSSLNALVLFLTKIVYCTENWSMVPGSTKNLEAYKLMDQVLNIVPTINLYIDFQVVNLDQYTYLFLRILCKWAFGWKSSRRLRWKLHVKQLLLAVQTFSSFIGIIVICCGTITEVHDLSF